jgi:hypothetical protein
LSEGETLVLLTVADEPELAELFDAAVARGLAPMAFREPDRGDELTALAVPEGGARLLSQLPLLR